MRILEQRGRLYLHGSFPRKDGQPGNAQTKITLQLNDDEFGQREAAKALKRAEKELKNGTWDWADWVINSNRWNGKHCTRKPRTWREAINALYKKKVTLGRLSESSWQVNYWGTLKLIPQQEDVTTASIAAALGRYERHQPVYKKLWYLLKDISRLTDVEFPEIGVPLFSQTDKVSEIPEDDYIIAWVQASPEPYRWFFGMMATYGLRPHECLECRTMDVNGTLLVQVDNDTKTGYRTVTPNMKEWVDLFDLRNRTEMPESERDSNRKDACSVWLNAQRRRMKITYRPYMLRHAFAARLWREGGSELDITSAAKVMGHSTKVHERTYRRWIDPNQIAMTVMEAIERNQAKKLAAAERSLLQDSVYVDS